MVAPTAETPGQEARHRAHSAGYSCKEHDVRMARSTKSTMDGGAPAQVAPASRLELIRKRHRELILKPRQSIAADFNDEFGDPFEEILEGDQVEMAETVDAVDGENY
jgi:hypothetical protein